VGGDCHNDIQGVSLADPWTRDLRLTRGGAGRFGPKKTRGHGGGIWKKKKEAARGGRLLNRHEGIIEIWKTKKETTFREFLCNSN